MRKTFLATAIFLAAGVFAATAANIPTKVKDEDVVITPYLGCYERSSVEKLLSDGEYATLYRGNGPDGRVNEVWINVQGYTVTVVFQTPKNGESENIKNVCVTNVVKSTIYNGDVVEVMSKTFEKQQGTKL